VLIAAIAVTGLHSRAFGWIHAALNSIEGAVKRIVGYESGQ
jgi:hypothetical protein